MYDEQIDERRLKAFRKAGKEYDFVEKDPTLPVDCFEQVDIDHVTAFLIFYTMACRFGLCTGCNLPAHSSLNHVGTEPIAKQLEAMLKAPQLADGGLDRFTRVVISNNGSVLDEETFPTMALGYCLARLTMAMPNLREVSLETRVEYIDHTELAWLDRVRRESDLEIELAIGFEAFDDDVRNRDFRKALPISAFEAALDKLEPYGFGIRTYFMLKPVASMGTYAAIRDIHQAIKYLGETRVNNCVMHLNPTYVAGKTSLEKAFNRGEYKPPTLMDAALSILPGAMYPGIGVFLGLNDEGNAVAGGSFRRRGDEAIADALENFNRTQDYRKLASAMLAISGWDADYPGARQLLTEYVDSGAPYPLANGLELIF